MKKIPFVVFLVCQLAACRFAGAEGTKELNPTGIGGGTTGLYLCNDFVNHCATLTGPMRQFAAYTETQSSDTNDRLCFRVVNPSEAVYLGFQGGTTGGPSKHLVYRISEWSTGMVVQAEQNLPTSGMTGYIAQYSQAAAGPNQLNPGAGGYDAVVFIPPAPGTYSIEFSQRSNTTNQIAVGSFNLNLFDITVADTVSHVAIPGRLYAKLWQFYTTGGSAIYSGEDYILRDDSTIVKATFSYLQANAWTQIANQNGCGFLNNWVVDRKSVYHQEALFPQYKIFLNLPDQMVFPGTGTIGGFVEPMPFTVSDCNTGHVFFHVAVSKPGYVSVSLNFGAGYQFREMEMAVNAGSNILEWDGYDGAYPPVPVANNTVVSCQARYLGGQTSMPLYDAEKCPGGMTLSMVSPAGGPLTLYWDDTNIPTGTFNLSGCFPFLICHSWANQIGTAGFGDRSTINTWFYTTDITTSMPDFVEHRMPLTTPFLSSTPDTLCENSTGHLFSVVSDPSTTEYHWSYSPPEGVVISQATPGSNSVTLSVGPGAASGTLSVFGTNGSCPGPGPVTGHSVTLIPNLLPGVPGTVSGPACVAPGDTGVIYSVPAGQNALGYGWQVPPGATIVSGGTGKTIRVNFDTTAVSGMITAFAYNHCGTSAFSEGLLVTVGPVVPGSLSLFNLTIGLEDTVCYNAVQNLSVAGNGTYFRVLKGGSASFVSSGQVFCLPGTVVEDKGYLHAWITTDSNYCDGTAVPAAKLAGIGHVVEEVHALPDITVYPNPFSDVLEIRIPGPVSDNLVLIDILDLFGRKIYSSEHKGFLKGVISPGACPPGLYLLKVSTGTKHYCGKIVKED